MAPSPGSGPVQECRSRAAQVIAASADFASLDARLEMKLRSALGTSLVMIGGPLSEIEPPLVRALHLAQSLGAVDYQLRSLHSLWITKDRGLSYWRTNSSGSHRRLPIGNSAKSW